MDSAEKRKSDRARSLSTATRAIAGDKEMELLLRPAPPSANAAASNEAPALEGKKLRLPVSDPTPLTPADISLLRGHADAAALRLAHHDPTLHARNAPAGQQARRFFDLLEQARFESLGANRMPGVARNLADVLEQRWQQEVAEPQPEDADAGQTALVCQVAALLARERLCGAKIPPSATQSLSQWRAWIEDKAAPTLARLPDAMDSQETFAACIQKLLADLGWGEEGGIDRQEEESEQPDSSEDKPSEDVSEQESPDEASAQDTAADNPSTEDMETADALEMEMGETDSPDAAMETDEPGRNLPPEMSEEQDAAAYQVFTRAYDEIAAADTLCDAEEMRILRAQLDRQLEALQGNIARLAHRLQRRLLALQQRDWEFERDEGILDSARLARVICDPSAPLSFKVEREIRFRDTLVSLLLDNSGSMRGRPINTAAICADILARTLERCGVGVEILGFTTRAWKGGKAREAWIKAGKPEHPGRLNELRHIIYKPADIPWRRARRSLGLMLREGLLKENIDGEAVAWAHHRLLARPEQRRILMVISDGAPVDDSTLSVNSGNYLESHLREVIARIEERSPVQLVAIGIGHDVTRLYRRAVTLNDASQLGGALMEKLAELFDDEEHPPRPAFKRHAHRIHASRQTPQGAR